MSTPTPPDLHEPGDIPTADEALMAARRLLTALAENARDDGEQARAEVALAHLDDVWPLPGPADPASFEARGAVLLDEAISAVVTVVSTAQDAQTRARGLRALEIIASRPDPTSGQP